MKKILFFIFLSMSVTCFAQDSLSIEPRQINEADSIHVDTHTLLDNKLEDVTKTKGDSAYIKEDYAAAIQIYEALLKNGEASEVYYNLGNSYYKIGEIAKAVLNYERVRQSRDLQPADSRLHGPRIGHDLPGRRTDRSRTERLRAARRGAATGRILGHAALHGRPDLPRSRRHIPRRAGHRAGPGPQQMVDHRRMRADDPAGLGPQPDGIHGICVQIPARIQ